MNDLRLISTDELVKELENRCKTMICAYETYDDARTEDYSTWFGKGKFRDAMGLLGVLQDEMIRMWEERQAETDQGREGAGGVGSGEN